MTKSESGDRTVMDRGMSEIDSLGRDIENSINAVIPNKVRGRKRKGIHEDLPKHIYASPCSDGNHRYYASVYYNGTCKKSPRRDTVEEAKADLEEILKEVLNLVSAHDSNARSRSLKDDRTARRLHESFSSARIAEPERDRAAKRSTGPGKPKVDEHAPKETQVNGDTQKNGGTHFAWHPILLVSDRNSKSGFGEINRASAIPSFDPCLLVRTQRNISESTPGPVEPAKPRVFGKPAADYVFVNPIAPPKKKVIKKKPEPSVPSAPNAPVSSSAGLGKSEYGVVTVFGDVRIVRTSIGITVHVNSKTCQSVTVVTRE